VKAKKKEEKEQPSIFISPLFIPKREDFCKKKDDPITLSFMKSLWLNPLSSPNHIG